MPSRYYNVDRVGSFVIVESSSASALADYALDWNGMIQIKIKYGFMPNSVLLERLTFKG